MPARRNVAQNEPSLCVGDGRTGEPGQPDLRTGERGAGLAIEDAAREPAGARPARHGQWPQGGLERAAPHDRELTRCRLIPGEPERQAVRARPHVAQPELAARVGPQQDVQLRDADGHTLERHARQLVDDAAGDRHARTVGGHLRGRDGRRRDCSQQQDRVDAGAAHGLPAVFG